LCSQCKVFVVDNDKQHICLESIKSKSKYFLTHWFYEFYLLQIPIFLFTDIPKKNFSTKNLFDDLSDEESIAETSIQSG